MGQTQGNAPAPKKKTEEQIKEDMKRKWDNFGTTQASNKIKIYTQFPQEMMTMI